METWFRNHYEDPAERVSYQTSEGGYLWVAGLGPHYANEAIQEEFSHVADFDLMMEAVEAVQEEGTYDWASTDWFREIDEEALRERDKEDRKEGFPYTLPLTFGGRPSAGTAPVFEKGVFEPGVFEEEEQRLDEATARRNMLERLDRLEEMMAPLVAQVGMVGHNNPPGPIEDPDIPDPVLHPTEPPLTARDVAIVQTAIQDIRAQAQESEPNLEAVQKSQGVLARAARQIGRWCMSFVDEAVKSAGNATGKAAVVLIAGTIGWQQIGPVVESAASSVAAWIQTIPIPW